MKQCGAKTRSGEPCKNTAVMANGRCRLHGGKSLVGVALPQYKDGRYSRYMPKRLLEQYERAANDGDLLVMRDDIAIIDTRLAELLSKLDSGETGAAWAKAMENYAALQDAIAAGDAAGLKSSLDAMGGALRRGQAGYHAWREVGEMLDLRRKLVESERKRLVQLSQMVTAEQAMVLVMAVTKLVKEHVDDQRALIAISDGIRRIIAAEGR